MSVLLLASGAALGSPFYSDGPPPAHTGGFGEPTCHVCHTGAAPETTGAAGALTLTLPQAYMPGSRYRITVSLRDAALGRGGFQLAARFATGPRAGEQAGTLSALDARVTVVAGPRDVLYAQHTAAGTVPASPLPRQGEGDRGRGTSERDRTRGTSEGNRERRTSQADSGSGLYWTFAWVAPAVAAAPVVFHIAANAADDDASPLGDVIHVASTTVPIHTKPAR